ncbi:hypothetical protein PDO_1298 [Rhizobium sp. PDO1-076]|uniref:hypothetical protein n=1 Tax=Rhizobium sp. PDO1-076 TaxID=1125979 RepID=UPI00024E3069|nr:hypothetical protein [Rhizobium sp. PDO1-076]EHS52891.1 hypothetical protein PDO_1298 [Rhizobium sp. PDO1-076]
MAAGIGNIRLTDKPLIVCDVDDVVLQFATPFAAFLESRGHRLIPRSFKLTGNIVSDLDEAVLEAPAVQALIDDFFIAQERWQTPFAEAVDALHSLAGTADLVFLTAMPPRHTDARRRLLDQLTLHYPLIAADEAKGPLVAALHADRSLPVAFVDDMAHNLTSVGEHVPACLLIYMPPPIEIHTFAPPPQAHVCKVADWIEAKSMITRHFAI